MVIIINKPSLVNNGLPIRFFVWLDASLAFLIPQICNLIPTDNNCALSPLLCCILLFDCLFVCLYVCEAPR
jgi:hypothetical protein